MNPYEFAGTIVCPHCRAEIGRCCVTADGYERKVPCVDRVKLVEWPDLATLPDTTPDDGRLPRAPRPGYTNALHEPWESQ